MCYISQGCQTFNSLHPFKFFSPQRFQVTFQHPLLSKTQVSAQPHSQQPLHSCSCQTSFQPLVETNSQHPLQLNCQHPLQVSSQPPLKFHSRAQWQSSSLFSSQSNSLHPLQSKLQTSPLVLCPASSTPRLQPYVPPSTLHDLPGYALHVQQAQLAKDVIAKLIAKLWSSVLNVRPCCEQPMSGFQQINFSPAKRQMKEPSTVGSGALALILTGLILLCCHGTQATTLNSVSESNSHLNGTMRNLDYGEAFHRNDETGVFSKSQNVLKASHNDRSWREATQNWTQPWKARLPFCDDLLKISRHAVADVYGSTLAWTVLPFHSCDQRSEPPEIRINPLKLLQANMKSSLLLQVLHFLGDAGLLDDTQQRKALTLLKKQILKARKPSVKIDSGKRDVCPDTWPNAIPWHPGHNAKRSTVIGHGVTLRLESSATFQSLLIEDGGVLIFADAQKPLTLRTQYLLIRNGGALHIGSARCPYRSSATISLYGRAAERSEVPNFGLKFLGVDAGGILELHGEKTLSWTLLDRTLHAGGLPHGPYRWEKRWGSRGLNMRVIDGDTGQVLATERFDTHLSEDEGQRLKAFLARQSVGRVVAVAVGDSAAKSLSLEIRHFLRDTLRSKHIIHLSYRQPWVLVTVLGGGAFSTTEDKQQYEVNGTTGLAMAAREFETCEGLRFTVTAYSGWSKGVPQSGFKVEASEGIVLNLMDDVTSWLPGNRIVIASTDYSMHQTEEFTLLPCAECGSHQVKISGTPQYLHIGEIVDGIDMRAEVGLLTRNIRIQGEMQERCYGQNHCQFFPFDTFGGHIKIQRQFGSIHLSGVELTHLGQQVLGSYPVHFHLAGDVDEKGGYDPPTYLENLSIHHCFSRCVAIHGTHGLLVKDTIGYDTLGHCFFLEDGVEQRNTFHHNLGLLTKPGTLLPTDRSESMCLAIRNNVYGSYVPVPSTDCMAVSTFWIANPNNSLIGNAAAGAQDVGIWYIFHRVPSGQSEGQYPEGQAEFTPLGTFYNNRVHSNFKAGLFIGKGIKTTKASAENPREYLTIDNARFRPHKDADPAKPRVPAVIDGLIAFKNNDHGAWARGGDIIFQNSGFSDNGIGLTLASDGTFPTDEGSSLEVRDSIFVGESNNVGSKGGQNSYWGRGARGEQRTLPRNKTFPIRGFQIYDGPLRLLKCTFRKFTPSADRPSSAIGFFMKNSWQITPQNNISQVKMERNVGLKVFFGKPGQWFGDNNNDGDKVSIFHDLDGSLTGYADTFIGRADNFLIQNPGCFTVPRWNAVICPGKYAQLYIQARRPENLTLLVARATYPAHPLRLVGVNRGAPYQQYQPVVMLQQAYTMRWDGRPPEEIILYPINFNRGDWLYVALCYPGDSTFTVVSDVYQRQTGRVHSVRHLKPTPSMQRFLSQTEEQRFFYVDRDLGYLFIHLQAHASRKGHSYCSQHGCERIKITARQSEGYTIDCPANPFPEAISRMQAPRLTTTRRHVAHCSECGAPQVAISSNPSIDYVKIQVQSLRTVDAQGNLKSAFIKVNEDVFPFKRYGLFFLVLDACSGTVISKRHFDIENAAAVPTLTKYVLRSLPQRSVVVICSRGTKMPPSGLEMSVFMKLGSVKPVTLFEKGSFAMLGYKGQPTPSWIQILNHSADQRPASLLSYLPLMQREYRCPPQHTKP
ncbi:cell surface hyaluronidase-like isoform X1 [Pleurodeles waltl]